MSLHPLSAHMLGCELLFTAGAVAGGAVLRAKGHPALGVAAWCFAGLTMAVVVSTAIQERYFPVRNILLGLLVATLLSAAGLACSWLWRRVGPGAAVAVGLVILYGAAFGVGAAMDALEQRRKRRAR